MNIFYLIIICCFHSAAANRLAMPVFLIDNELILYSVSVPTNPFHKMTTDTFTDIVHSAQIHSERLVIFVEDDFSVEDVSAKDKHGTPYVYLSQAVSDGKVKYIPNVIEPFKTLKEMFPPLQSNVFYLTDAVKSFEGNYKYYYVFFQDIGHNETRIEKLRRHDKIIRKAFKDVRDSSPGPVVAFYTGKMNPIEVMGHVSYLPQDGAGQEPEPEPTSMMIVTEGALFRLNGVYSTSGSRRSLQAAPAVAEETMSHRRMLTRMLYSDFEIEFNFRFRTEDWLLDSVSLLEGGEEVGRTRMDVGAPWDWSYFCSEPLVIINMRDGSAVVIEQYQLEPLPTNNFLRSANDSGADDSGENGPGRNDTGGNDTDGKTCFTNALNCGPYFNTHILACLWVTAILLLILFYGVVSLFNCVGNDRYDDANGKPLVIVAQM